MFVTIIAAAFLLWVVLGGIVAMTLCPLLGESVGQTKASQKAARDSAADSRTRSAADWAD